MMEGTLAPITTPHPTKLRKLIHHLGSAIPTLTRGAKLHQITCPIEEFMVELMVKEHWFQEPKIHPLHDIRKSHQSMQRAKPNHRNDQGWTHAHLTIQGSHHSANGWWANNYCEGCCIAQHQTRIDRFKYQYWLDHKECVIATNKVSSIELGNWATYKTNEL